MTLRRTKTNMSLTITTAVCFRSVCPERVLSVSLNRFQQKTTNTATSKSVKKETIRKEECGEAVVGIDSSSGNQAKQRLRSATIQRNKTLLERLTLPQAKARVTSIMCQEKERMDIDETVVRWCAARIQARITLFTLVRSKRRVNVSSMRCADVVGEDAKLSPTSARLGDEGQTPSSAALTRNTMTCFETSNDKTKRTNKQKNDVLETANHRGRMIKGGYYKNNADARECGKPGAQDTTATPKRTIH